jgi:hypothetical protein
VVELIAACLTGVEGVFEPELIVYKTTFWLLDPALRTRMLAMEQSYWRSTWYQRAIGPEWVYDVHSWQQIQIGSAKDDVRTAFRDLPTRARQLVDRSVTIHRCLSARPAWIRLLLSDF